jgi:hypothetical protein
MCDALQGASAKRFSYCFSSQDAIIGMIANQTPGGYLTGNDGVAADFLVLAN